MLLCSWDIVRFSSKRKTWRSLGNDGDGSWSNWKDEGGSELRTMCEFVLPGRSRMTIFKLTKLLLLFWSSQPENFVQVIGFGSVSTSICVCVFRWKRLCCIFLWLHSLRIDYNTYWWYLQVRKSCSHSNSFRCRNSCWMGSLQRFLLHPNLVLLAHFLHLNSCRLELRRIALLHKFAHVSVIGACCGPAIEFCRLWA